MKKILIVEGACKWDSNLKKALTHTGFHVMSIKALLSIRQHLSDYQPDLVLIGMENHRDQCWQLFRYLIKQHTFLPALIYHIADAKGVEEVAEVVVEAFRDAEGRNRPIRRNSQQWYAPRHAAMTN